MPTVALAAIVKNEAPVVRRMLDSVRPFIAAWCVVDTGSTDGTQAIVREAMAGMPGELHERPWVNFGANRSESIALARPLADYLLLVDADDTVQADSGFTWDGLTEDVGRILVRDRSTSYWRAHLLSTRKPFRFDGVVHESVACDAPTTSQALTGITYHRGCDGARSTDPNKFKRDAEALETAFATDPTNARTTFYVAQSWRDFGELEKAVSYYRRRVQMGGWAEEAWYALFQVAVLLDRLNKPPSEVVEAYLLAHAVRPSRAEPLCALARYHRLRNEWQPAYNCAARAMRIPKPEGDILFIDESVAWRARDEFALAAYWLGKRNESRRANEALLASSDLPTEQRARIEKNLSFTKPTDNAAAFSRIYETSAWGGGSGPGSDPANATAYLARLRAFIRTHSVKSIVDLGCGDWRLMREVDLTEIDYLGIDVVPSVVDTNNARFGGTNIRF